ncbi:MAG: site-2 protease family protein [Saprospiraceae bacterium]|nr:site-2 protease family protein [Saprospiraceae bacterium]
MVLHEYGHAIAAKFYKVKTKDIILSPIGGVARLENLPEKAGQELVIAISGPAVNLILALILFAILTFTGFDGYGDTRQLMQSDSFQDYAVAGLWINVMLFSFNLIPAFPMDGGRVLRALLAMKLGKGRATKIAGWIGRVIALVFVMIGLYSEEYMFAMLGVFIFLMARVEMNEVIVGEKLVSKKVAEFMRKDFPSLHLGATLDEAIERYKRNGEGNFVVMDSLNYVAGILTSGHILQAQAMNREDDQVSKWMTDQIEYIDENATLKTAYDVLNKNSLTLLLVRDAEEKLVATLDRDALMRAVNLFS